MKIPNSLKIGAHTFAVVHRDVGGDRCGLTDYVKQTISLDSQLTGTVELAVLIHEVLHVCNSELDHALLDSIAQQITQVLVDNDMLKEQP